MNSLEHALETVAYAKKHVLEFQSAVASYMRDEPCRLVIEYGFGPAQHIHKAKWLKPIPSDLKRLCFAAIRDLRSALDHAGYALAIANGKSGANAHFPFGDSEAVLANDWATGAGRSREIPRELFDLMMRFKPYPGGDDALCGLNHLRNVGEHEIIRPMVMQIGKLSIDHFSAGDGVYGYTFPPVWDGEQNEMVFARTAVNADIKYQFKFTAFIAINNQTKLIGGQEATPLLHHLFRKVEGIVLALEAEARRVGLFK